MDKVPENIGTYRPGESPQEVAALQRRIKDMSNDTNQHGGRKQKNFKAIL